MMYYFAARVVVCRREGARPKVFGNSYIVNKIKVIGFVIQLLYNPTHALFTLQNTLTSTFKANKMLKTCL